MRNNYITVRKINDVYTPTSTNKKLLKLCSTLDNFNYSDSSNIRGFLNDTIRKNYLNEGVIKSAFVEKHCFTKSSKKNITIFELKAKNSRADICTINGKSIVYEIKTEYDTFNRLESQLLDYKELFDYIYVIVPKKNIIRILKYIDDSIGLIVYRKSNRDNILFKIEREAQLNRYISSETQVKQISLNHLRSLIDNSNTMTKKQLVSLITEKYTTSEINEIFKDYYRTKYKSKWKYLCDNRDEIYFLDYQWFFKNNISAKIVYK